MTPLGVKQFQPADPKKGWAPGNGTVVIQGISYNGHPLENAGAMVFDGGGNIWGK